MSICPCSLCCALYAVRPWRTSVMERTCGVMVSSWSSSTFLGMPLPYLPVVFPIYCLSAVVFGLLGRRIPKRAFRRIFGKARFDDG